MRISIRLVLILATSAAFAREENNGAILLTVNNLPDKEQLDAHIRAGGECTADKCTQGKDLGEVVLQTQSPLVLQIDTDREQRIQNLNMGNVSIDVDSFNKTNGVTIWGTTAGIEKAVLTIRPEGKIDPKTGGTLLITYVRKIHIFSKNEVSKAPRKLNLKPWKNGWGLFDPETGDLIGEIKLNVRKGKTFSVVGIDDVIPEKKRDPDGPVKHMASAPPQQGNN